MYLGENNVLEKGRGKNIKYFDNMFISLCHAVANIFLLVGSDVLSKALSKSEEYNRA